MADNQFGETRLVALCKTPFVPPALWAKIPSALLPLVLIVPAVCWTLTVPPEPAWPTLPA